MTPRLGEIWVYLEASPLLGLTLTLLAYQGALIVHKRCGGHPLANPVLIAVTALVTLLSLTGTPYQTYFDGAQFVHFLLGPATVALAIPLYRQIDAIKKSLLAIVVALLTGSVTAVASAIGIGWALGGTAPILLSLAPKSVTTPIAMGVSEQIGGLPSLTAAMVVLTGIFGATFGPWLLDRVRVSDQMARGIAMGVAAHGIGTARMIHLNPVAGAFSGLAMGLNGLATAILLPALVGLFR